MEKRYKSYFHEAKEKKYFKLLDQAIHCLKDAKLIYDKLLIHESINNYKNANNPGLVYNAEFTSKIKQARKYLEQASDTLENVTENSTAEQIRVLLVRSKLKLVGGLPVLNTQVSTSERKSGDNVKSLIIDMSNFNKLTDHEISLMLGLMQEFMLICNGHNSICIKANDKFNTVDFESNVYIVSFKDLIKISDKFKKVLN